MKRPRSTRHSHALADESLFLRLGGRDHLGLTHLECWKACVVGVRNVERTSLNGLPVRSLDLIREARAAFSYRISTRALFTQRDAHPLARQHIT